MRWNRSFAYPLVLVGGTALAPQSSVRETHPPPPSLEVTEGSPRARLEVPQRVLESSVHYGAESPELRALRIAEGNLFPELGPVQVFMGPFPEADDWGSDGVRTDINRSGGRLRRAASIRQSWLIGLNLPDLPVEPNARVARYIDYFTKNAEGRSTFEVWLRRSGNYRVLMRREMDARGLPRDLRAVAFIESGMWPTAVSHAGATGLWQFMPQTARAYGLTVQEQYDERRSIWKSTAAAARHLRDLHANLKSWDLALAAYNMGYAPLLRQMEAYGAYDFWTVSAIEGALPRETVLYVPKVLAVATILNNLDTFKFAHVDAEPPLQASAIEIPPKTRLSLVARAAGTSLRRLRQLNPEFRAAHAPDSGAPVVIRIPSSGLSRARAMLPELLERPDDAPLDIKVAHDFNWGDSDDDSLRRLRATSPGISREARDYSRGKPALGSAQRPLTPVKIRGRTVPRKEAPSQPQSKSKPVATISSRDLLYEVGRGDTLSEIAEYFGISQYKLAATNRIKDPDVVVIGQRLKLPDGKKK